MNITQQPTANRLRWGALVALIMLLAACTPQPADADPSSAAPTESEEDPAGANDTPQALTGGTYSVAAGDAGTVTLTIGDGTVDLASVEPADGWSEGESEEDGDRAAVQLAGEDGEVAVNAQVDDSDLEVDLGWVMPLPSGSVTLPAGEAGSVTLVVEGGTARVESTAPNSGFSIAEEDDDDDGDAEVHFVNPDTKTRVEFDARVEGDRLVVAVDTTVGQSFEEPDDADDEEDGDDSAEDNDDAAGGGDDDDDDEED